MKNIVLLKPLFSLAFFIAFIATNQGQEIGPEALYREKIPMTPEVFNGGEYVEYPSAYIGHAFFQSTAYNYADIVFNGIVYKDIPLLYDLVSQNLIALNPIHAKKVILQSNRISEFIIHSDFGDVKFVKGSTKVVAGDYADIFLEEIVEDGLYAYHQKSLQREIKELERNTRFDQSESLLLFHGGELNPLKTKQSAIRILGMEKKLAREVIKEKGLKYRLDRRAYQTAIVQAYQKTLRNE
jgi:hypothetical protein